MRLLGIIFALILLATTPTFAATLSGKVVSVADGDTITILTPEKEQVKIRLVEIDAPEKDQAYGQDSKKALSDLVFMKDVSVEWDKTDKYKRTLGRVFVGDTDVNLQQVKNGAAWAYTQYLTDERIKQAENEARAAKAGLWALQADQIMPPWEWRRSQRGKD
jgi:micrococcal nuclease